MIVFNHMIACYFFPQERKEKPDNPPPVPISSSICGTTMTSASISSRVGRPRCIPQTSATYTECVISCHFLCRPAWSAFASWFCIFADSRGMVTFCSIRLWFRLWECTLVGTFCPLFHPCMTSPVSPLLSIMDGWMGLLPVTLSSWSLVSSLSHASPCPCCPCLHFSPVMCHPVSAHCFFTLIVSVLSQLIFRPAYSFSASPPPCPHYSLLVIRFFNFSTHSLHSSFSLPFLLLLQSNLSDLSLFPPVTKSVSWRSGFLSQFTFLPLHFQICFLGFFGFEVGNCYSMLLDLYKGDGAKYGWQVISLLSLISRPGSDMACIPCEAVDEPWTRAWNHRKWGASGTASHP